MKILRLCGLLAAPALFVSPAFAQRTLFSIDWQSPTVSMLDSASFTPITQGDMLGAAGGVPMLGPLLTPEIVVSHGLGGLGLAPGCVGSLPGSGCPVEVDAFSYGIDDMMTIAGIAPGALQFGVDRFAVGVGPFAPNVLTESSVAEAAGDIFLNVNFLPPGPLGPGPTVGHRGVLDGNGLVSGSGFAYAGLGLIEPAPPTSTPQNPGDNLDALDTLAASSVPGPDVYYSLDAVFPDPLSGLPNLGSALPYGFTGADVLQSTLGFPPVIYANEWQLGLGLSGLAEDLDALILVENGNGTFQPSQTAYDWIGGTTDMLLFSIKRGSGSIGLPDSQFGIPIEEGDILTTPLPIGFGGLSPYPAIFIAAENLGLATVRSGTALGFGDDLNAMDSYTGLFNDCDGDNVEDVVAIAMGWVLDLNMNGIPDPCEITPICTPLPNSTTQTTLLTAMNTGSPGTGVHVEITQGPPSMIGILLIGTGLSPTGILVGSGRLCLDTLNGNLASRYNVANTPMNSVGFFNNAGIMQNVAGTSTVTTGFDIPVQIPIPIGGTITVGSTWYFQYWHRDIPLTSNFSNAITWTF